MSQSQPKLSGTFLVNGANGLTRIAYTQDFNKRMSEWRAASPFPLHVVAAVTTPKSTTDLVQWLRRRGVDCSPMDSRSVHGALKRTLAHLRFSGEWYALDDATLSSIPAERICSASEDGRQDTWLKDTWLKVTVDDDCGGGTAWLRECPVCAVVAENDLWIAEHNPQVRPAPSPKAPLVWQVVGYADDLCSHLVGSARLGAMTDRIVEWLVVHGRNDIAVVAQFMAEYEGLKDAAMNAIYRNGQYASPDFVWDNLSWLVLQGEVIFSRILATPKLLDDWWGTTGYATGFAQIALNQIVPVGKYEGTEHDYLLDRLSDKAHPAQFAGWDGARLAAETARCHE